MKTENPSPATAPAFSFGRRVTRCRMCDSERLFRFLDLGFAPPSDSLLTAADLLEPEPNYPLQVQQCEDCGLTQTAYAVNPALMYGEKYLYESSITKTGRAHFEEMAASIVQKLAIPAGSLAIDIGSNVGVLLDGFKKVGLKVLGIEPAPRINRLANERGIETWQEFMRPEVARRIVAEKGRARIITATNVFAHIDDKKGLADSIKLLLDDHGAFVIEVPHLPELIEHLEYDTVYHEHLEYMSVKPLTIFFRRHGLEVFDVEWYAIHGNSIRVFIGRAGDHPVSPHVARMLETEETKGLYRRDVLLRFAADVESSSRELRELLFGLRQQGKRIVGISAPAKGNTILNYCRFGPETIAYMAEKSLIKRGCYTPGMHIPIVGEERLVIDKPDYGIIFAWNFAAEIMANNQAFAAQGGKFIIPIPRPQVV